MERRNVTRRDGCIRQATLEATAEAGRAVGGVWEGAGEEECVAARTAVHAAHHATAAAQGAVRQLAAAAADDDPSGSAAQLASELEGTLHAAASELVEADRCMARVVLSVQLWAGMVSTQAAEVEELRMSRERSARSTREVPPSPVPIADMMRTPGTYDPVKDARGVVGSLIRRKPQPAAAGTPLPLGMPESIAARLSDAYPADDDAGRVDEQANAAEHDECRVEARRPNAPPTATRLREAAAGRAANAEAEDARRDTGRKPSVAQSGAPTAARLREAAGRAASVKSSAEEDESDRMSTITAGGESECGGVVWDAAVSYRAASLQRRSLRALRRAVAAMVGPRKTAARGFRYHRMRRVWAAWISHRRALAVLVSTHLRHLRRTRSLRAWVAYMQSTARRLKLVLILQRRCRLRVLRRVWRWLAPYLATKIRHGKQMRALLRHRWTVRARVVVRFWREWATAEAAFRARTAPLRSRIGRRMLREAAGRWHARSVARLLLCRVFQHATHLWEARAALPSHAALFACAGRCLARWRERCVLRRRLRHEAAALHAADAHYRVRVLCGCWTTLRSAAAATRVRQRHLRRVIFDEGRGRRVWRAIGGTGSSGVQQWMKFVLADKWNVTRGRARLIRRSGGGRRGLRSLRLGRAPRGIASGGCRRRRCGCYGATPREVERSRRIS